MNEKREIKTYKSIDEMVEYLYKSKRIIICIELLQDYYLQMCSENTPLRLTNGVLGVFFIY